MTPAAAKKDQTQEVLEHLEDIKASFAEYRNTMRDEMNGLTVTFENEQSSTFS